MAAPKKAAASAEQDKTNGGSPPEFTKEQELKALRDMLLIRRFEEKAGQLYGMGAIGGFCHLYIGQEAVVVGMQMALKQGDQVITGYRDHGHMLATGMEANGVMAELTGRRGGYSKGKGGSMHMFSKEKHFYGGHGIVGAQVSLGTGLAFANNYRGNGNVSVTYFGDGAANQGQVYESFNMAELWKLPVIYVIENNRYAMGTAVSRASAQQDFSKRGAVLQHSRPAGRRHGRPRREGRRRRGGRLVPRRQGPDHSGDADLPLSRPFDVRPGKIPHARGGREGPPRPGSDRAGAQPPARGQGERGTTSRRSTPRCATSSTRPPTSPSMIPSRMPPSSGPTFTAKRAQAFFGVDMPIQVLMPALSPTMEKGNLSKWLKKEGEKIKSGDVIAEIETDKATMEVEATDEGTLGKILIPEGTADVAVNTPIATILADGESAADLAKAPAPAEAGRGGCSRPRCRRKAEAPRRRPRLRHRPSPSPIPKCPPAPR